MFCVYLTIYRGSLLPPFYIGSTSIENIERGYIGSVSSARYGGIFNSEKKNNRQLFETRIIKRFADRKDALAYEEFLHKQLDVKNSPLYINMSTARGDFISDTRGQNNPACRLSVRKKISDSLKSFYLNPVNRSVIRSLNRKRMESEKIRSVISNSLRKSNDQRFHHYFFADIRSNSFEKLSSQDGTIRIHRPGLRNGIQPIMKGVFFALNREELVIRSNRVLSDLDIHRIHRIAFKKHCKKNRLCYPKIFEMVIGGKTFKGKDVLKEFQRHFAMTSGSAQNALRRIARNSQAHYRGIEFSIYHDLYTHNTGRKVK